MDLLGRLFGGNGARPGPGIGQHRPEEVEALIGKFLVGFHDNTSLSFVLMLPVVHKVAAKLFVEDYGAERALNHYERVWAMLSSEGFPRESQFKSFGWPEVPLKEKSKTEELELELWGLIRELVGNGALKETIAGGLLNVCLKAGAKLNPLIGSGYLLTILRELRAGVHTIVEKRPEVAEDTDEATTLIFNQIRDLSYTFKERSGIEWQHMLPGLQRFCTIYCLKYRDKAETLELFGKQLSALEPLLADSESNPPQALPLSPLHIENMAKYDEVIQQLTASYLEAPEIHPAMIAYALSMLVTKLASDRYDLIFLKALLMTSCIDIEAGKFDHVTRTHSRGGGGSN